MQLRIELPLHLHRVFRFFLLAVALSMAQVAPSEFSKLVASASSHILQRRLDSAIQDLTKAAALEPRSAFVHLLLEEKTRNGI